MTARSRRRSSTPTARSATAGARRRAERRHQRPNWLRWAAALAMIGVVGAAAAAFMLLARGDTTTRAEPAEPVVALAEANSGGAVRILTGSAHTVYHSERPLPSAAAPRTDGKVTLVWFSGTWCDVCESMEPYVHQTAAAFRDQVVLVEKSVDHARGDATHFAVRGTPTFVVLDPQGTEVTRFHYQSAAGFQAAMARLAGRDETRRARRARSFGNSCRVIAVTSGPPDRNYVGSAPRTCGCEG